MKIAYLANIRFPSERAHAAQIAYMSQAFVANNLEVELFANNRAGADNKSIAAYFGFSPTFQVIRLRSGLFSHKILLSFYLSDILFVLNFLLTQKPKKFDIIYSRNEWHVFYLSYFLNRKRLVWESHEAKLNFPARALLKKGIKTVVISDGIQEEYLKVGIVRSQLLVAHDGIDESFFGTIQSKEVVRKKLGLPSDKKIAMYIGGFDEWKGVETFFGAAALGPEVLFVAIGGSAEQVTTLSQKYPAVTFLGSLPYADLKDNQQAADVLVIPNTAKIELSSRFTSPLKLFAHMASGVPIVASDVSSIVSVTGREAVSLVPADDRVALAAGIQSVFEDYESKKQHAQALKEVSMRYTWTQRAKEIINFIT